MKYEPDSLQLYLPELWVATFSKMNHVVLNTRSLCRHAIILNLFQEVDQVFPHYSISIPGTISVLRAHDVDNEVYREAA